MTGEEMERAIEFILQHQAMHEARIGQTQEQIAETQQQLAQTQKQVAETQQQLAETDRLVQMHAGTQTEFIKIVTKAISDLADAQRQANEALVDALRRTDDRVDRLAETVERFISEGRDGKA